MKKKDTNLTPAQLRAQITKAQMEIAMRKSKNTNAAKNLKKSLARLLTYANI